MIKNSEKIIKRISIRLSYKIVLLLLLLINALFLSNFINNNKNYLNDNEKYNELKNLKGSDDTNVGGLISSNTTWTKASSPYIVTSNVLVMSGISLTIEPGVVIKLGSDKLIRISGELIARGTEEEPIIFTSNQTFPLPGDWDCIEFTNSANDAKFGNMGNYLSGSIMQYCTIEYSGRDDTPGLKILSSSPFIDHCNISNNKYRGLYLNNSFSTIANNIISNNSGGGIYVSSSEMKIINNVINNNSEFQKGGGVYIEGGIVTLKENKITNNIIKQTTPVYDRLEGGGIFAFNSIINIINNKIINNSVINTHTERAFDEAHVFGGGIYIQGGSAKVIDNIITDNYLKAMTDEYFVPDARASGGGIYINSDFANISGNTIRHNSLVAKSPGGAYGTAFTSGGGICIEGDSGYIYDNLVSDNSLNSTTDSWWRDAHAYGGGIYVNGEGLNVKNNNVTNNNLTAFASSTYYHGEWEYVHAYGLGGGIYINGNPANLNGNIFRGNFISTSTSGGGSNYSHGGGVYILSDLINITSNIIAENTVTALNSGDGGGLYASGSGKIMRNKINNNSASGNGGGIYAYINGFIEGNHIINNSANNEGGGIYTSKSPTTINYNKITGNILKGNGKGGGICIKERANIHYVNIFNNYPYDIYNCLIAGSPNIDSTNNWWGTTNDLSIQAHIYDWIDNNTIGLVSYIPYLTSPVTDFTPPLTPAVFDDGYYTNNNHELHATWDSSDTESGIIEYQYAISSYSNVIVNWTSVGMNTEIIRTGLFLDWGTTYFFFVRAKNTWEHWSEVGISDGIIVYDNSIALTPIVTDDGEYVFDVNQLHASWISSDPESGIIEYQYAIGTYPGGINIVSWSSRGSNNEVTHNGLSLNSGTTYYFAVKARNGQGLWSEEGISDGITGDITPPNINKPADITYVEGTTGHIIRWVVIDNNPDNCIIYMDGVIISYSFWTSNIPIEINVDDLPNGRYELTIEVFDVFKNINSDSVIVIVSKKTPSIVGYPWLLMYFIFAVLFIIIILMKKSKILIDNS